MVVGYSDNLSFVEKDKVGAVGASEPWDKLCIILVADFSVENLTDALVIHAVVVACYTDGNLMSVGDFGTIFVFLGFGVEGADFQCVPICGVTAKVESLHCF